MSQLRIETFRISWDDILFGEHVAANGGGLDVERFGRDTGHGGGACARRAFRPIDTINAHLSELRGLLLAGPDGEGVSKRPAFALRPPPRVRYLCGAQSTTDGTRSIIMLVPPDMLAAQSKMLYQINKYYGERVQTRMATIAKTIREVCKVVQDVLKEVEVQEPRFISSLTECNGRYEGLEVISPNEFEVVLYLNQMGVFNFVDDGTLPGCAVLKLSDGRKRSMSLWVEFITASGYLSARKIRSR
ncbi:hypothetical protein GEV33_013175 [Tenebrio molitor]|uniref:Mab-21-like nucleotidyltransferase domain-containing protein n=1 Tax=Tenebrio molitor TaxID=7067 RepID=A0A8J6L876_TENMO|nr:hypothetical protein GEV33_013175 [Tenebrio molitor]